MSALKKFFKGLPTKKTIASLIISGFLLVSFVPKVQAGIRFDQEDQRLNNFKQSNINSDGSQETAVKKGGGKVKGTEIADLCARNPIPDPLDLIPDLPCIPFPGPDLDVTDPFGTAFSGANTVIKQGLQWFAEHILKILFEITLKVILYVVHIFASVFGLDTSEACKEPNITSEEKETCENMTKEIGKIDLVLTFLS